MEDGARKKVTFVGAGNTGGAMAEMMASRGYADVVLIDIVRSNIAVARVVLGLTQSQRVTPGFMSVPLDMRDPHGLAVLAVILTATPGTVWVDLSEDGSRLTLHVLNLQDEEAWIRLIKQRYERPLMAIFESARAVEEPS